ncbi:hypothetical protein [Natrinema marinum]|uniref:hypothetical protein n=1 Tax=Natrinema marinum TaxID=2961598 RepID=UPI0020C88549|nr:hypothetical protein [Natrinema marinum]
MGLEFTTERIKNSCYEYRQTQENRSPLELDVDHRWAEEQEILRRFPTQFQNSGCIEQPKDFKVLTRWKWAGLWSNHAKKNSAERIERITRAAFSWVPECSPQSRNTIFKDQIGVLTCLEGVRPAMASVILTFWKPEEYTVMDERALAALANSADEKYQWTEHQKATRKHYPTYVKICKQIQDDLNNTFSLRQIDRALWVLGGKI